MRPIVTDVPWSVCVRARARVRVCVCVCVVHIGKPCPAKTVEPIEMPFGLVGPRNHMLVVGPDPPTGTVTLGACTGYPLGN